MTIAWTSFAFGCIAAWLSGALLLALMALSDWFAARRSREVDARTEPGLPPAVVAEDLTARLRRRDALEAERLIDDTKLYHRGTW
jgi:hypothetical protein